MPPHKQLAAGVSSSLTDVVSLACVLAVLAVYAVQSPPLSVVLVQLVVWHDASNGLGYIGSVSRIRGCTRAPAKGMPFSGPNGPLSLFTPVMPDEATAKVYPDRLKRGIGYLGR